VSVSEKKKFLLRLDAELYDALEKWAADELRSVNAQMEYVLKEAVRKAGRLPGKEEKKP
jgi:hypothetical protein